VFGIHYTTCGCFIKHKIFVIKQFYFQELLDRTNYSLDVTTGQRRYGGPPPKDVYDGDEPGAGCQVRHFLITALFALQC